MSDPTRRPGSGLPAAILFARLLLALLFLMPGWAKVFGIGPLEVAREMFVGDYAGTWIPVWLLWAAGTAVPFVELVGGALLAVGLWVRPVLLILAGHLLMVTYGELLADPLWNVSTHVFPRALLVIALLSAPAVWDRWSVDTWRRRPDSGSGGGGSTDRPQ